MTLLQPTRRGFLGFLAAPAIVKIANIMPVRSLPVAWEVKPDMGHRYIVSDGGEPRYWNVEASMQRKILLLKDAGIWHKLTHFVDHTGKNWVETS